jgi:hypothetical protein
MLEFVVRAPCIKSSRSKRFPRDREDRDTDRHSAAVLDPEAFGLERRSKEAIQERTRQEQIAASVVTPSQSLQDDLQDHDGKENAVHVRQLLQKEASSSKQFAHIGAPVAPERVNAYVMTASKPRKCRETKHHPSSGTEDSEGLQESRLLIVRRNVAKNFERGHNVEGLALIWQLGDGSPQNRARAPALRTVARKEREI